MPRPHNVPRDSERRVQQHFALGNSASDIMAKHIKGPNRLLPVTHTPGLAREPRFEEVTSKSYHDMMNIVAGVKTKFLGLSARLRTRFSNDPLQMLRFIEDPRNRMECVRLGLVLPTDDEYNTLSQEAETKRLEALGKALRPSEDVPRPDDEAQPDYGTRARKQAQDTPQKGGKGGK